MKSTNEFYNFKTATNSVQNFNKNKGCKPLVLLQREKQNSNFMKAIFFFIFILIQSILLPPVLKAADYYISNEFGNDERSIIEARNPDTPWKSIDKINSIINFLQPGDAILFKRGETFYGTLHISASGTTTSPIKIGSYGIGNNPVITSLKTIKDWIAVGNGVYESKAPINAPTVHVVLIQGEIHEMGRFPNKSIKNEGYLTIDNISDRFSIISDQLSDLPNWNNGELVIKKNQWVINKYKIKSHNGNQIHYKGKIGGYEDRVNFGFFIQNHINTLDTYGEWYFDPSTRKIKVFFGTQPPSTLTIEVSTLDNLLTKDYKDGNFRIENIHFKGSNKDAIKLEGGNNVTIVDSDISFSGENAILALSVTNLAIERNKIWQTYNNGMYLRYGNINAIIRDNEVRNTALVAGRTKNDDAAGIGIFLRGDNGLIQNNTVVNSGYNGIQFIGNDTHVKNNFVDTFCQIKGDGGGIYIFGGVKYKEYKGIKIEGNIVINSIGSKGGIPKKGPNHKPLAEGIFLDDNVNNVDIISNTIGNTANSGLKMSNVNKINVTNNLIFNSFAAITLGNNKIGEDTRNVKITGNQFFSKTPYQKSYSIRTYKNDIDLMGDFDKNIFFRPFGDDFSIFIQNEIHDKKITETHNLDQWRDKFKKDQNSISHTINQSTYTIDKKIGESLYTNSSFDKNLNGTSCNNCEQSWEVTGKTDGGSYKVSSLGPSSVKINLGKLEKDKTYLIKLNTHASRTGYLQAYLRYSGSPWEKLSTVRTFRTESEVNNIEIPISPYKDAEEVSLMIANSENNLTYWIDDLEFTEIVASFIDPEKEILFEYNPTRSTKVLKLSGNYVNAKLEKVSGEITIPAYGSVVLLRVPE